MFCQEWFGAKSTDGKTNNDLFCLFKMHGIFLAFFSGECVGVYMNAQVCERDTAALSLLVAVSPRSPQGLITPSAVNESVGGPSLFLSFFFFLVFLM